MDPKSQIARWCAKNKCPVVYELVSQTGLAHDKEYISRVTINDKSVIGKTPKKRIKDSEQEAAREYIEQFGFEVESTAMFDIDEDTCYYIDLENCADLDLTHFNHYVTVASAASSKSILKRSTHITSCTRADAADVALIVKLTGDIINNRYSSYAVVSRDKLLFTAVEVIEAEYDTKIDLIFP